MIIYYIIITAGRVIPPRRIISVSWCLVFVNSLDLLAVIIAASGADSVRKGVLTAVFAFYDSRSGSLPYALAPFISSCA